MEFIANEIRNSAYTYDQYRTLVEEELAAGRSTGRLQTPALLEYTRLNVQRMNRLDKTFRPDAQASALIGQINRPQLWLAITEGWCGDAAQILPVLNGLAQQNPLLDLRLILRDDHSDVMEAFLTNGSRSIPKVILVDPAQGRVLGSWGPRPAEAQALMMAVKADMKALEHDPVARKARYEEGQTALHTWYARDRTLSTQREMAAAARDAVAALNPASA